jgi:hypothetical protein
MRTRAKTVHDIIAAIKERQIEMIGYPPSV